MSSSSNGGGSRKSHHHGHHSPPSANNRRGGSVETVEEKGSPVSPADLDCIQTLSLEEVRVDSPDHHHHHHQKHKSSSRKEAGSSILKGSSSSSKRSHARGSRVPSSRKAAPSSSSSSSSHSSSGGIFNVEGGDGNIVRSGHSEINTLWASNDCAPSGPITVNVCNAPNNSTMQCGCENIDCPFCNLMLSIQKTDPSVLQ